MPKYLLISPSMLLGQKSVSIDPPQQQCAENDLSWKQQKQYDPFGDQANPFPYRKGPYWAHSVLKNGVQTVELLNKLAQHDYQLIFCDTWISGQNTTLKRIEAACAAKKITLPKVVAIVGSQTRVYAGEKGYNSLNPLKEQSDNGIWQVTFTGSAAYPNRHTDLKAASREAFSAAFNIETAKRKEHIVLDQDPAVVEAAKKEGHTAYSINPDNSNENLETTLANLYEQILQKEAGEAISNNLLTGNMRSMLITHLVALKREFDSIEDSSQRDAVKMATQTLIAKSIAALTPETSDQAKQAIANYRNELLQFSLGQKVFIGAMVFAGLILGAIGGIYLISQIAIGVAKGDVEARLSPMLADFGIFKFDPFKAHICEFSKKIDVTIDQVISSKMVDSSASLVHG